MRDGGEIPALRTIAVGPDKHITIPFSMGLGVHTRVFAATQDLSAAGTTDVIRLDHLREDADTLRLCLARTIEQTVEVTEGGRPLSDARVSVFQSSARLPPFDSDGWGGETHSPSGAVAHRIPRHVSTTGPDGRTSFRWPAGFPFRLQVVAARCSTLTQSTLTPACDRPLQVEMTPQATLSVEVVCNTTGHAAQELAVTALELGGCRQTYAATTEDHLAFRFAGLPPGDYVVGADAAVTLAEALTPGDARALGTGSDALAVVSLAPGEHAEIHLEIADLASGRIIGTVRGPEHDPGSLRVAAVPAGATSAFSAQSVVLDRAGRFEIGPLPSGPYELRFASLSSRLYPLATVPVRAEAGRTVVVHVDIAWCLAEFRLESALPVGVTIISARKKGAVHCFRLRGGAPVRIDLACGDYTMAVRSPNGNLIAQEALSAVPGRVLVAVHGP